MVCSLESRVVIGSGPIYALKPDAVPEGAPRIPGHGSCRLLRLIYVEHDRGNAPIRTTIQRINDMDSQEREQIIAEEAKGGWKTRLAA